MSAPAPFPVDHDRRHDLDWIRVGAFMLLILYHVGMFYVPWDWHVNSPNPVPVLEPIMTLTSPWRLTLLFLVSGCATRFLSDSFHRQGKAPAALAGSRTLRLLPPLLFGMFVIVPPQSYYEVIEAMQGLYPQITDPAHHPFVADFWTRYATGAGHWCDADGCLTTPTWNHLWFVAYLFVYSLLLAALLAIPGVRRGLEKAAGLFEDWGLVVWPLLGLALIRLLLAARFPITHNLVEDWYNHALSLGGFLFGYVIARSDAIRIQLIALRWPALIVALVSYALYTGYLAAYDGQTPPDMVRRVILVIYALDQAGFIAAILGFGARWLNRGGPVLRYLTIGVFPFYIVHQTITVVVAHHLAKLGWPQGLEALTLIGTTVLGCWLTYEIARRIGWFGLLLGVRPTARPQAANRPPRAA